ncbi:MAG: SsrA-binding protein SmpB [Anaerolineales bacterium]
MTDEGIKVVARNRKAQHEFFLEDRYEAGIALRGTEIKSVRAGQVSLQQAYVHIEQGEAWLHGAHIAPYDPASNMNHDPTRTRKLLLKKRELRKLERDVEAKGYTIVPTQMYITRGLAKVEIALAKGKRQYDKRRKLKERDAERQIERALSRRR